MLEYILIATLIIAVSANMVSFLMLFGMLKTESDLLDSYSDILEKRQSELEYTIRQQKNVEEMVEEIINPKPFIAKAKDSPRYVKLKNSKSTAHKDMFLNTKSKKKATS